jgi:hypothetical protein
LVKAFFYNAQKNTSQAVFSFSRAEKVLCPFIWFLGFFRTDFSVTSSPPRHLHGFPAIDILVATATESFIFGALPATHTPLGTAMLTQLDENSTIAQQRKYGPILAVACTQFSRWPLPRQQPDTNS